MGTATESRRTANSNRRRKPGRPGTVKGPEDWVQWRRYLATRRTPQPIGRLLSKHHESVLTWPLADEWHGSPSEKFVRTLERVSRGESTSNTRLVRHLEQWLETPQEDGAHAAFAIECVAWAHALPALAETLPAAPWCQLLEHLQSIAEQSAGLDLLAQPLEQQVLGGELPLSLAYLFPELPACQRLGTSALSTLAHGVVELLDGEGLPGASTLRMTRGLLACWARCGYMADGMKLRIFDGPSRVQLEWLVLQVLRLTRNDGSHVFTTGLSGAYCGSLFDAALALLGDRADQQVAKTLLPRRGRSATRSVKSGLPSPAVNSEWAEVAVLRRDWAPDSEQLAVTYGASQLDWELNCGKSTVWSGSGTPDIAIDGQPLDPVGEWEEACWQSDEDVDYLELEMPYAGGRCLQRQILLARQDRFLFVSDVLLGEQAGDIHYRHTLPLAAGVEYRPEEETREGFLGMKRRVATVLPLALPEWRCQRNAGSLQQQRRELMYELRTTGERLYAPLFFDLHPQRLKRQRTWRRLTVAERLETQRPDQAVGYRVQAGREQWMFYRSLTPPRNRTLLGQNTAVEFVAARFRPDGTVDNLIEIE